MNLPDYLHSDSDGEIRFRGHRIRLIDVVARYEEGYVAESILLDWYPQLPLALIHKAIAFYLENEAEVEAVRNANDAEIERLAGMPSTTPTLAELRPRFKMQRPTKAS
jgi:uncharacterized protein (DUF433 family)